MHARLFKVDILLSDRSATSCPPPIHPLLVPFALFCEKPLKMCKDLTAFHTATMILNDTYKEYKSSANRVPNNWPRHIMAVLAS